MSQAVQVLAAAFSEALSKLNISDLSQGERIALGAHLWGLSGSVAQTLGSLKESLSDKAGDLPGETTLKGEGGSSCTLVSPLPKVVMKEGVTWAQVEEALGPQALTFFKLHVSPRADFHEQTESCSPETLHKLVRLAELEERPSPRVLFKL